jgi:hypothetical protein
LKEEDQTMKLNLLAHETKSHRAKNTSRALGVSRLTRSVIYKPLAAVLAVLLIPSLSSFESTAGIPLGAAKSFQASAQTIQGCAPSPANAIIQTLCPGNNTAYVADLQKLESDAVSAYLGLHGLPATDAQMIYTYGRADLRSAVRAGMYAQLLAIIEKPALNRSQHEQNLYAWFQGLVWKNEIAEYTLAVNEFQLFESNPCEFTLDPTIASAYKLSYDGTPFCFGSSLNTLFSGPPVPAASYFIAYGLKNSYGASAATFPNFGLLLAQTEASVGEEIGIGAAAGAVVADIVGIAVAASIGAAIALGTANGTAAVAAASAAFIVSGATATAVGPVLLVAGPVAIVLIAVAIGVAAGLQAFSNQQNLNDSNNLSNTLTQVTNTPPDLTAMATDSSGVGLTKLYETLVAQTLPDVPSTATLPAHQTTDPSFLLAPSGGTGEVNNALTYQDWNGNSWTAQTYGGTFVQTCNSGTNCTQADSIIAGIRYVDSSGTNWTASRLGNNFVSTKNAPASTDQPCPANQTTGVSPLPSSGNFSACSSYVSASIPVTAPGGAPINVSLSQAPAFTGPTTLSFTPGQSLTEAITASGVPAPSICYSSGNLSSDFTLNGGTCGNGTFQLSFNGDMNAASATNQLTLQASNNSGTTATQVFTINVSPTLAITSPSTFSGNLGVPQNFLVTTTGYPPPRLSVTPGWLPPGLTLTDNGNGTATISGTDNSVVAITQNCSTTSPPPTGCGIIATNPVTMATVNQQTAFKLFPAPNASLVGTSSTTFIAGAPNSVVLTSFGAITPVSYSFTEPADASWLSFHDNGNGTGVLSGMPPVGTTGTYTFILDPIAVASLASATGLSANFTLNVVDTPIFLSPNSATFTAGTAGSFEIQTNGNSATTGFSFPQGLAFSAGDPATITGAPAAGTGGVYNILLTDNAGAAGTATQQFTLNIDEAPQITSANSATFFTGVPGSFAVTTTGYPTLSTQPVSQNSTPPTSPTQGEGMYFTVTGLPADLQYSNLNPQGLASGTLTIQGTPSPGDAGPHQVQITAQNGVGVMAQQTLMLDIVKVTGPAPASGAKCNGNYNGIFNGSVTVSAGQNCSFVEGGGITGNVTMNGGNLAIMNGTITGNVQIQGASAFSFGPGSKITGNLKIQNVASGTTTNQICGAKLLGNVQISGNATPFEFGSASADSCPGNFVGGSLAIQSNTGAVTVYDTDVTKNLSCSGNTSITGGGDTAESMQGQCAAF